MTSAVVLALTPVEVRASVGNSLLRITADARGSRRLVGPRFLAWPAHRPDGSPSPVSFAVPNEPRRRFPRRKAAVVRDGGRRPGHLRCRLPRRRRPVQHPRVRTAPRSCGCHGLVSLVLGAGGVALGLALGRWAQSPLAPILSLAAIGVLRQLLGCPPAARQGVGQGEDAGELTSVDVLERLERRPAGRDISGRHHRHIVLLAPDMAAIVPSGLTSTSVRAGRRWPSPR